MAPKVSVVMAVYNGERYLRQSVESILGQTFADFEFIIVDDGSTDNTGTILESTRDHRIVLIRNQQNIGLAASLNKGLALAQGDYVARMDADDIALPHRFERQVAFLDENPDVGILGSACQVIDEAGVDQGIYRVPTYDLAIRWYSLIFNSFLHPCVMLRRSVLERHGLKYDEQLRVTQDYDLWTRLLSVTRGANLPEPLLLFRRSNTNVSTVRHDEQLQNHDYVAHRALNDFAPQFAVTLEQVRSLRRLFRNHFREPEEEILWAQLITLYLALFDLFARRHADSPQLEALRRQVAASVASLALARRRRPGWMREIWRSMRVERGIPWGVLSFIAGVLTRKIGRHVRSVTQTGAS